MEDNLRLTIETYNSIAQSYMKATHNLCPWRDFEVFCQSVVPEGLILDAGCAWGRDCQAFAERGFAVIGIDLSAEMIKLARHYTPTCDFIHGDFRSIPIDDGSVDGIWCCASLLHLERFQVPFALTEFKRILKIGATCCILLKKGTWEGIVKQGLSRGKPRYFTYFLQEELHEQCISTGFTILEEHTMPEQRGRKQRGYHREWINMLICQVQ